MKFEELGINTQILESIKRLGITTPTPIQEKTIPPILEGKDVIGESATGSGKTLAFGTGILEKISGQGLQAIVLTPTRELAEQVKENLKSMADRKLKILAVYGGVSINPQIDKLPSANIVVGTPGRMLDHLERGTIDLSKVKVLVLDEADRMLDMGFIEDVEKIISQCPKERQTLFFSATMHYEIVELAEAYMKNPIRVSVTKHVDPTKLKQVYYDVPKNMRLSLLAHLLEQEPSTLVMIFCNTRSNADFVVKNLRANKIRATAIHGGLSQNKRTKTIDMFNEGKAGVLVCTDVAARGLHIDNVTHIYNYDIPADPKDYVHRIGRTARAGEEGKVINLLCEYDYDNFSRVLEEYPEFNIEKVEKPYVKQLRVVKEQRRPQRGFRNGRKPRQRAHA